MGSASGDTTPCRWSRTPATELFPALSPDGRWLAYGSDESGTFGGLRAAVPRDGVGQVAGLHGRRAQPTWRTPGASCSTSTARTRWSRQRSRRDDFSVGEQRTLFSVQQFPAVGAVPAYSLTPDDQRFLMLREGEAGQQGELVVAENWVQQLAAAGAK